MNRSETTAATLREAVGPVNEPAGQLQSFADKSGKSLAEVERLYNKAKEQAKEGYPDVDQDSDRFYKIVTGILKQMLGLKD